MKFRIERIFRSDNSDEQPLTAQIAVWPVEAETSLYPVDKVYFFDIAAKHLETFSAFREIVADTFAFWLSGPSDNAPPFDLRAGNEWNNMVSKAFDAGRQHKEDASGPPAQETEDDITDYHRFGDITDIHGFGDLLNEFRHLSVGVLRRTVQFARVIAAQEDRNAPV